MRLRIKIDDALMNEAIKASRCTTPEETVEAGLRLLVQKKKQNSIRKLRGKLKWSGNLDQMRTD